jgi:hypothetical protein
MEAGQGSTGRIPPTTGRTKYHITATTMPANVSMATSVRIVTGLSIQIRSAAELTVDQLKEVSRMGEQKAMNVGPARIEMAYERFGDPMSPPVLLIMGGVFPG